VPGAEAHHWFEPDGDEQGQEYEHQGPAHGEHGLSQGKREQDAQTPYEADHERALAVERPAEAAGGPLPGTVLS
jgi:hypothetical protein